MEFSSSIFGVFQPKSEQLVSMATNTSNFEMIIIFVVSAPLLTHDMKIKDIHEYAFLIFFEIL